MCKCTTYAIIGNLGRTAFITRAKFKGWSTERAERAWSYLISRATHA